MTSSIDTPRGLLALLTAGTIPQHTKSPTGLGQMTTIYVPRPTATRHTTSWSPAWFGPDHSEPLFQIETEPSVPEGWLGSTSDRLEVRHVPHNPVNTKRSWLMAGSFATGGLNLPETWRAFCRRAHQNLRRC